MKSRQAQHSQISRSLLHRGWHLSVGWLDIERRQGEVEIDAILSMSDEEILADFHCTPEEYAKLMRQVFELTAKLVRTEEAVQDLITICRGHLSNAHAWESMYENEKRCRDEEARKPTSRYIVWCEQRYARIGHKPSFDKYAGGLRAGRLH